MSKYSDGEFQPSYEESIRGIRVFLFHFSKFRNLMELLLMIDAKRASADILCCNTLLRLGKAGYRKDKPRVPIGAN
jgi:ribose-phosphate pyrophosphokinase